MLYLHNPKSMIMKRHITPLLLGITLLLSSCHGNQQNNTITIFHAGSLAMPIRAIADSFKVLHPDVTFRLEAAGSVECARKITEFNRQCDIMASADYKIIDELLIPDYADWNVLFSGNEMSLVHTKQSRHANDINGDNWYEILAKPEVSYGRSDPNADPCGYRTLLTLQLAEQHYQKPGLAKSIAEKDNRFIRPKEVDLIALLESGAIDYIFLYRSVAVQHGLEYVALPDEINLGNPSLSDLYSGVHVRIRGAAVGDSLTLYGEPMVYGITIPSNAPNRAMAVEYLKLFLHPHKGLKTIEQMGMIPLRPLIIHNEDGMDKNLREELTVNP